MRMTPPVAETSPEGNGWVEWLDWDAWQQECHGCAIPPGPFL